MGKDIFAGLCTGYAPAPLGDNLSRFNLLLRDMENCRPEEFSRVFFTDGAPLGPGQARDHDETSPSSVLAAMHLNAETRASRRLEERLWQARVILRLSEILDRREAEVNMGLSQISSVEKKVFASLVGDDGSSINFLADPNGPGNARQRAEKKIQPAKPLSGTSGQLVALRLKAWAELYLADSSNRLPAVLAAASPENGTAILEGYENTWHRSPKKLFSLAIPSGHQYGTEGTVDRYLEARNTFRTAVQENLEYFTRLIQATACSETNHQGKDSLLAANIFTWDEKLQAHFNGPDKVYGRLDFYCFPGSPLAEIFQRLFRLDRSVAANRRNHPTGVLAILKS